MHSQRTPASIADFLSPILLAENFDATLSKEQYSKLLDLSGLTDQDLRVALLPFAAAYAHASMSEFLCWRDCSRLIWTFVFRRKPRNFRNSTRPDRTR